MVNRNSLENKLRQELDKKGREALEKAATRIERAYALDKMTEEKLKEGYNRYMQTEKQNKQALANLGRRYESLDKQLRLHEEEIEKRLRRSYHRRLKYTRGQFGQYRQ